MQLKHAKGVGQIVGGGVRFGDKDNENVDVHVIFFSEIAAYVTMHRKTDVKQTFLTHLDHTLSTLSTFLTHLVLMKVLSVDKLCKIFKMC